MAMEITGFTQFIGPDFRQNSEITTLWTDGSHDPAVPRQS